MKTYQAGNYHIYKDNGVSVPLGWLSKTKAKHIIEFVEQYGPLFDWKGWEREQ